MLTYWPQRRIASIVPSISSLRRSTLCWCHRRFRPSVFTVAAEPCRVTIAGSYPVDLIDSTAYLRRFPGCNLRERQTPADAVTVTTQNGRPRRRSQGRRRHRVATSIADDGGGVVGLNG